MPCYMCVRWPTFSAALFLQVFFSKGKDKKAMNQTNQLWDDLKKKKNMLKPWRKTTQMTDYFHSFMMEWTAIKWSTANDIIKSDSMVKLLTYNSWHYVRVKPERSTHCMFISGIHFIRMWLSSLKRWRSCMQWEALQDKVVLSEEMSSTCLVWSGNGAGRDFQSFIPLKAPVYRPQEEIPSCF